MSAYPPESRHQGGALTERLVLGRLVRSVKDIHRPQVSAGFRAPS